MARKGDTIDGTARGRVAGALVAVVVLQVLFALSYLAAFHDPAPHRLRISVAAPSAQLAAQTVTRLTAAAGDALDPQAVATAEQARAQVRGRLAQAGFVIGQSGDTLYVASAASVSQSGLLTSRFQALEAAQHRTLTVTDVAPLPKADSRGVAPFYVTLVMVFGGYLGVTVLSLVTGPAPNRLRAAGLRLGALAAYSVVSALAVVLAARAAFGVLDGHVPAAIGAAALICFATAATAVTMQALLGVAGTALVILLFVVVGNPASGGAVPYGLLPSVYRHIGQYLVNGAGVDLLRNLTYFGAHDVARPLVVLLIWAFGGAAGAMTVGARRYRRLSAAQLELAPAIAAGL